MAVNTISKIFSEKFNFAKNMQILEDIKFKLRLIKDLPTLGSFKVTISISWELFWRMEVPPAVLGKVMSANDRIRDV